MRDKLTAALVAQFKPAPGKDRDYIWDTSLPGFGLMATAKGGRSYVVQYRLGTGRSRRMRIGDPKTVNLDEARRLARVKLGEVAGGADPQAQRRAERQEHRAGRHDTVAVVVQRYLDRHAKPHLRWHPELKRTLERDVVSKWRDRAISDIADTDVAALIETIADRAPVQANKTLVAIKMMMNWCVDRRILKASPAAGLKPPTPEKSRDRVLLDDELRAVWLAADAEPYPFGPCVKLLILTAQRRDEIAGMRWDEVDLDAATWVIPAARAKNGQAHEVQLSTQAIDILRQLPQVEGAEYAFTTTGRSKVSGFSKLKLRLDQASKVNDWIFHDLRRSAVTGMARLGIPPHVADKVLNHRQGSIRGVAAVYNRFEYQPERRAGLQAWANFVDAVANNDHATNVIALRASGGVP
jgi:integrase